MREDENLEEIFDRYVGLELLSSSWPPTLGAAEAPGASYANVAVEDVSPQFWGETLLQGGMDAA